MQPVVAKTRSFRRLLEFWTIVAENDDKTEKMVYEYWLRLVVRPKSGGPSLGRSPGAHKQRRPVNQNQIQIFGEIGSTQFLEQGLPPCSFFFCGRACFFSKACALHPEGGALLRGVSKDDSPLAAHPCGLARLAAQDDDRSRFHSRSRKLDPISAFFLIGS